MSRFLRFSLIALAVILLTALGSGVVLAAGVATSVATNGLVVVSVHEKAPDGVSFTAPIPAALVSLGMNVANTAAGDELAEARQRLEPYGDSLLAMLDDLADADDVALIRVEDGTELVTVRKTGGYLVIDVDDDDAEVHVTLPLSLVRQVIGSLAS